MKISIMLFYTYYIESKIYEYKTSQRKFECMKIGQRPLNLGVYNLNLDVFNYNDA